MPPVEAPPRPSAPKPVEDAAGALFAAVAKVRRSRSLHPRGIAFAAAATFERDTPLVADAGRSYEALVRFSRGAGFPSRVLDANGLAVRIVDAHGAGRDQDLLMVVSRAGPLARHLIVPARSFTTEPYSTILTYRAEPGGLVVVGALPPAGVQPATLDELPALAAAGVLRYRLAVARVGRQWEAVGEVTVQGGPLPDEENPRLAFNPWTTGKTFRPAGPLNALRDAVYRRSQRARLGG